jgi:hypothetical protein
MRWLAVLFLSVLLAPLARAELNGIAPPVLSVAGKQVPLPAGQWIVAGSDSGALSQGGPIGSYGAIQNLVLLRMASASQVDAVAEINVNAMAVGDGWGVAGDCQRQDLLLVAMRSRSGWDAACFFIARSTRNDTGELPVAWRQAERLAARSGLTLPGEATMAGFRVANRRDVVDVRFHFRRMPQRELAEWSAMMIGCVEAGMKNHLAAAQAVPNPDADETALARSSLLRRKQQQLDVLLSAGVMTTDDHARQTSLLLSEASNATGDAGADQFYRLLSFQGLSITSDAAVTFLWTAQSVPAAVLTVLQAGMRTGRNYLASYLWDSYVGGPTRPDIARTVDFAYGRVAVTAEIR